MTKPLVIQPGPAQRPNETPVVAPAPPPPPPDYRPDAPPSVIAASLRYSIKDAAAWAVMHGAGVLYVMPFLVLGGKGLVALAAFTAVPALAGALVQWGGANLTDAVGRRNRIIVSGACAQGLMWAPICVAVFLPLRQGYWLLLAAFALHVALANFVLPPWQSLMGDLVPADRRGRYFGLRNFLSGGVQVVAFFSAGWWVTLCAEQPLFARWGLSSRSFGFLVLFALAGIARLVSTWYLSRVHEPQYRHAHGDRFTLLEFIRRAPKAHFGRFVFYCMLVHTGLGFVGPFLGWYLLDQRGYSPGEFALVIATGLATCYVSQPLWGRLCDRWGSKRVLGIGGVGLIVIPVLLLLCRELWQFVGVLAFDGFMTGAYTLAVSNYFYDVVTPPKRARCVAYNNLFVAVGGAVGAFAGAALGVLVPLPLRLGPLTLSEPFTVLLAASLFVRLVANVLLLGTFAEFRLRRPAFVSAGAG